MKNQRYYNNFENLNKKSILITGGTGSFGKLFVKKVLKWFNPKKIVVFSRDEHKQYELEKELVELGYKDFRFFIGDVRDCERLKLALRNIEIVIHAAALKHVPSAEYNPFECIHTNIIGAQNIVTASIYSGVKKVIALSTDKACSPLNLYGASKLASDKIFVAANHLSEKNGCKFSVVRYGNVVNSRGSVISLYYELIKKKSKYLPITDRKMTRFWITLEQGIDFVLSSLDYMAGGEIFIPKIPSMKIIDLANLMAPSIPQKVIGIRPGEKLHEVMITEDDARYTSELKDRYIIFPSFNNWSRQSNSLSRYGKLIVRKKMPEGFRYSSDLNSEWLDKQKFDKILKYES